MVPRSHERELAELREQIAQLVAAAATAARSIADEQQRLAEAERLHAEIVAGLERALGSRDVIGQAKGVIMATMGCSPEDAFGRLSEQSQHENRKLVDVAGEIAQRAHRR